MTQKFRITLDLKIKGVKETITVAELEDALDFQLQLDDELRASAEGSLENIEELS